MEHVYNSAIENNDEQKLAVATALARSRALIDGAISKLPPLFIHGPPGTGLTAAALLFLSEPHIHTRTHSPYTLTHDSPTLYPGCNAQARP